MPTDTPTTEAKQMQTLNLTPQQLKHLKRHGSVWVWMPMKEQPTGSDRTKLAQILKARRPHRLDEMVELRSPVYIRSGVVVPDDSSPCMTTFAIVHATLATSPEPRRLDQVTEEQAVAMGYASVMWSEFVGQMKSTHPDLTPESYGWLFEIKES